MLEVSREEFEAMVIAALDALPDAMVDGLENVVFVVEDEPEGDDILGLYDGFSLPERGNYGFGELPDRIVVFRLPLLEMCASTEELVREIHTTLLHEIAHYFGIDDARLHELGYG